MGASLGGKSGRKEGRMGDEDGRSQSPSCFSKADETLDTSDR